MNSKINLNQEYLQSVSKFDEYDLEDLKEKEYAPKSSSQLQLQGIDPTDWIQPEQWDNQENFAKNTNLE